MDQNGISAFGFHFTGPEAMLIVGVLSIFGAFGAAEFAAHRTVDVTAGTVKKVAGHFGGK